jgi:hypothetical protein
VTSTAVDEATDADAERAVCEPDVVGEAVRGDGGGDDVDDGGGALLEDKLCIRRLFARQRAALAQFGACFEDC